MTEHTTWLTQSAYDRLAAELDHLRGAGRREIAARIEAAREEGDLKENGGYHAAKDQQGQQEARIRDLEELLKHAVVGNAPEADGTVAVGTVVTAKILGDEERFLLGSRELSAGAELEVYSEQSPLGAAILGRKVGDSVSYATPNGNRVEVTVLAVDTYQG